MYTIYTQHWSNGKISYHRSPNDILEFGRNQEEEVTRIGRYQYNQTADPAAFKRIENNLGVWG